MTKNARPTVISLYVNREITKASSPTPAQAQGSYHLETSSYGQHILSIVFPSILVHLREHEKREK